jgi:hypothetical protein
MLAWVLHGCSAVLTHDLLWFGCGSLGHVWTAPKEYHPARVAS